MSPTFGPISDSLSVMPVIVSVIEGELGAAAELGAVGDLLSSLHAAKSDAPTMRCTNCLVKSLSDDGLHRPSA